MHRAHVLAFGAFLAGCTLSANTSTRAGSRSGTDGEDPTHATVRTGGSQQVDGTKGPPFPVEAIPDHPEILLLLRETADGSMCSGSLIRTEKTKNRRVVLSAKHCFDNASDNVFAYAGRGKEISETDDLIPTPQTFLGRFKVTARFALADGSTDNRNLNLPNRIGYPFSDISVLILDHDLPEKVKPSEISRQAPDVEQDCVAVGYGNRGGKLGWQRPVTLDLKWVDDYNLVEISKNPQDPASLTGPGDSGGPLFCNVRGKKLQVGVVSGGSTLPNHRSDTYGAGFFARVDIVYDILEKILLKVDSGDALSPNDIPRQSDPMKP